MLERALPTVFAGALAGCGTLGVQASYWQREQEPALYVLGGTVFDVRMGVTSLVWGFTNNDATAIGALLLLDVPFSLAADVVLLPLAIYQQVDRARWSEERFVEELTSDRDPDVRCRAANALAWWEPRTGTTASALRTALRDESPSVRGAALAALAEIEALGAGDVIERLADDDPAVRAVAADHAFPHREALPVLILLLSDAEPEVRRSSMWGLAAFGSDASAAVPELERMSTSDPVPWLRRMSVRALEKIRAPPARAAAE